MANPIDRKFASMRRDVRRNFVANLLDQCQNCKNLSSRIRDRATTRHAGEPRRETLFEFDKAREANLCNCCRDL